MCGPIANKFIWKKILTFEDEVRILYIYFFQLIIIIFLKFLTANVLIFFRDCVDVK